ncbi:UDP-2,4-diacetamido-2,4,6-trideoxy-beta-L-altropyranose hydrolase [Gracilibacillus dipsosauri]|uniref:UDP-2,4-diacetamido-2,4, 6-trideoxy-beta-L-altropyranose hydrolase n=1 Tax=Gracilibacillus dipsosauri TaxID=178340 RepID=A0A317KYT5_9BACI|nr:UDP-2,4-diacetamido-2,4,6-trideoxy-beta-L-altropyranose hydrolase [Gracilibacillus dipsosauri]
MDALNIFIRTDASREIGTGHVMRCLVLADMLQENQANVIFICHDFPGHLIKEIKRHGFEVMVLSGSVDNNHFEWMLSEWKKDVKKTKEILSVYPSVDWLIIDHYAIDQKWEKAIRPKVKKIMVIDDLADRKHDCDLLLDQNELPNKESRYDRLIPENATTLLGINFVLLRKEFQQIHRRRVKSSNLKRILVSFGGSDPTNETMKVLKAIDQLPKTKLFVDVVIGSSNPFQQQLRDYCVARSDRELHIQIDYLVDLMVKADLAIGAGGTTTWERCYLHLPTITIETATNQTEILEHVANLGAIYHLGKSEEVTEEMIGSTLEQIMYHPILLKRMSDACQKLIKDYDQESLIKHIMEV